MGENDKLAEYAKLAEGEGRKVENSRVVMFDQDEAGAQAFADKARKAGLQVLVGLTQVQWVHGKGDPSGAPKEWGVTLL
jgi:hypothetical protein